MKVIKSKTEPKDNLSKTVTWEEESGLLEFLSSVNLEVQRFNEEFEFGISTVSPLPSAIDGDKEIIHKVGFVLERKNPLLPEARYCLYALLRNKALYSYIGIFEEGNIKTLKELKPINDFRKGKAVLYDWLRQLVRASCEKLML